MQLKFKEGVRRETVHKISTRLKRTFNKKPTVKPTSSQSSARHRTCYQYEGGHPATQLRHVNTVCSFCKRIGHIERACIKNKQEKNKEHNTVTHYDDESSYSEGNVEQLLHITSSFHLKSRHEPPTTAHPVFEGRVIKMEVDTGHLYQ